MSVNRFVASQRRELMSQQSSARPGKVPYRDIYDEEATYTSRNRPNTTNNETRKKQLQGLLNKEKNKEKMEKLQQVIIQRFAAKYGVKYTPLITFFVEEYVANHSSVDGDELDTLEREIGEAIRANPKDLLPGTYRSMKNGNQNHGSDSRPQTSANQTDANGTNAISRPPSGKEWLAIQMYQSLMDEEQIKKERALYKQKQQQFKALLDLQTKELSTLANVEKEEDRQYAKVVYADIERYNQEEHQKRIQLKQKYHEELLKQQQQIREMQKRHEDEKAEKLQEEEFNLQLAQMQIQQELDKQKRQRIAEREKYAKIKLENDENRRYRQVQKEVETQDNIRLMKEYEAKLDREEAAREEAFQTKLKEMEQYAKKFENEGAGKQQREERKRIELMILKEQERKEKMDEERERVKKQIQKENLQKQMQDNAQQLVYKQQKENEQRLKDTELRAQFQEEIERYQVEEKHKLEKKKVSQVTYRDTLDQQLQEMKKIDYKLVNITGEERKINNDVLTTLTTDQSVLQEVLTRMGATSRGGANGGAGNTRRQGAATAGNKNNKSKQ